MKKLGFRRLDAEHGIYVRGKGNSLIILAAYVDDIVIAHRCSKTEMEVGFLRELQGQFEIKDIGDLKFCLGIRIEKDEETGSVTLSQPAYIEELLEKVNLAGVRTKPTPFPPGLVLRKEDSPITEEGKHDMTLEPY